MTVVLDSILRPVRLVVVFLSATMLIASSPAESAESEEKAADAPLGNAAALEGVEEAKSVFLVNFDSPTRTAGYLNAMRGTHEGLIEQGVRSKVVIVFLGEAVQFLSTDPDAELAKTDGESLQSIAETAADLKSLDVQMEVCGAATKHFGVDNASLLDEMSVVGNGFISLIGWQAQGHAPMTF